MLKIVSRTQKIQSRIWIFSRKSIYVSKNEVKCTKSARGCTTKFSNFFGSIEFYAYRRAYFEDCGSVQKILYFLKQGYYRVCIRINYVPVLAQEPRLNYIDLDLIDFLLIYLSSYLFFLASSYLSTDIFEFFMILVLFCGKDFCHLHRGCGTLCVC